MGWLLSIVLSMLLNAGDVEFRMWFSKESYCIFAIEKFSEKPFMQVLQDGSELPGGVKSATCRELGSSLPSCRTCMNGFSENFSIAKMQ